MTNVANDPSFKSAFWDWFDSLEPKMKKSFHNYVEDTAEIYFYYQVWSK